MTAFPALARLVPDARPYQKRITARVSENWNRFESQLIVAPTGSGKSYLALEAGRRMVEEIAPRLHGVDPSEVGVFWMAMRSNLLTQTNKENHRFATQAMLEAASSLPYCPNLHFVSSFARRPDPGNYKIRLLISDEAHHSSTTSETTVLETIKPNYVLGLSATPLRTDNAQLCFQTSIKDAGYRTLIKEGYLSQFRHYAMEKWSPAHAVAKFLQEPERWGKSLFFFRTLAECREAEGLLRQGGYPTAVVWGGADRSPLLRDFLEGSTQTLISMSILAEGFDAPPLETVFVRDTYSSTVAIQMSGRVLRLHPGTPYKNIVQSVECRFPFLREANPFEQYIERDGRWVSVLASERAKQLMELTARRIRENPRNITMPDFKAIMASLNPKAEKVSASHRRRNRVETVDGDIV